MLAVPSAFMETSRWGGGVRMYAGYFTSLPYWKGEGEIKFPSFTLTLIYLKKKKKKVYLFLVALGLHCWAQLSLAVAAGATVQLCSRCWLLLL